MLFCGQGSSGGKEGKKCPVGSKEECRAAGVVFVLLQAAKEGALSGVLAARSALPRMTVDCYVGWDGPAGIARKVPGAVIRPFLLLPSKHPTSNSQWGKDL